jgi:tRNA(Ile)-lysidine synthase
VSVDDSILAHISQSLLHHTVSRATCSSIESVNLNLPPLTRLVVAYSGGVDSTVLLHAVVAAAKQGLIPFSLSSIVAVHVNHQLSDQANSWQQHCQQLAEGLGVTFVSKTVSVESTGKGVEAAARDARYAVFERFLQSDDCLLLGHHQGDQAETVLLRLLRGAGVKGLAAMPVSRAMGNANLLRPLLAVDQAAIQAYAQQYQLAWVEDESNQSDKYDRNLLRNKVMPLIAQRWPAIESKLCKTAETMTETSILLSGIAEDDLHQLNHQKARTGYSVDFALLNQLSLPRKKNLLRHWCEKLHYDLPDSQQMMQIEQQFFSRSALLSSACVSWGRYELRQFSGRLYLMEVLPKFISPLEIEWDGASDIDLQGAGVLRVVNKEAVFENAPEKTREKTTLKGISIKAQPYQIRWRQGGERCTPVKRQHSQTVKKLLQEHQLETWLRDRVPLIYAGNELVAVGDIWVNKGCEVSDVEGSVSVFWKCI